ncbi:MAG: sigma-70 family RNA polymerase sigma factor [Verrucomicrobiaceae bacterium]|nr:sigma-70 family RNA polymerase sigma factor [Verrucomicrobiaceae bacterium]
MAFPTTRWTLLAEATLHGDAAGREALARMCEDYRRPVMVYLLSRKLDAHEAEDAAQDFFLKLVESRVWRRADQAKGKFRTFLLSVLNHHMMQRVRNEHRLKRGGSQTTSSLDELQEAGFELLVVSSQEAAMFDREWALTLVADAVAQLESEFVRRGQKHEFQILNAFLPGASATLSYDAAATELETSLPALKASVHRLRQRFREILRSAVARTVGAPHEVDEELRYLGTLLTHPQHAAQPEALLRKEEVS